MISKKRLPKGIHYLCNSGVEIEGIYIWGSPITPIFYNWAFLRDRGSDIMREWNKMPSENLDILITHGPPPRS